MNGRGTRGNVYLPVQDIQGDTTVSLLKDHMELHLHRSLWI